MGFNLSHLLLHLTNLLVLFDFLFGVRDNVGSSEMLLELSITLLNIGKVASKVPLTVCEGFVLLVKVSKVTVTLSGLLNGYSLLISLHLS